MPVDFSQIQCGNEYSRPQLAAMWGYSGYQPLARGVVTPRNSHVIILFVTEIKQDSFEQYNDRFSGDILEWEGPNDHFAEERMIRSEKCDDEIHVFYRKEHHSVFTYLGIICILEVKKLSGRPSKFKFKIG